MSAVWCVPTAASLLRHLTEHAQPAVPVPRAHSCARRGQTFQEVGHYNKHIREQCPLWAVPADAGDCRENGQWKCPACSRTFGRSTDFSKHWPRCSVRPELAVAPPRQRHIHHNAHVMRSDARSDLSCEGSLSSHILLMLSWRQHCQCELFFISMLSNRVLPPPS